MVHVRQAALMAAAATATALFGIMDANPSLYIYDKLFVSSRRLKAHFGGNRIWIVGASSGIGASLARQLASSGANLVLSSRPSAKLDAVADSCRQHQQNVQVVPLEVTCSQQELEHAMDQVLQDGDLDCVILNAGVGQLAPAMETSPETQERLMRVNALAPMTIAATLLRKTNWMARKKGHLVVTSSIAAKGGVPLSAAYAASKHAIHGYMQSLQSEHPWLRLDMPCPGPVATHFHGSPPRDGELKMAVDRCAQLILSGMIMGRSGGETWIAQQPTLGFLYLSQHFPRLSSRILNTVGPLRMGMWKAGLNVYDPKAMRQYRKLKGNTEQTQPADAI